jgi:hypothetical protein
MGPNKFMLEKEKHRKGGNEREGSLLMVNDDKPRRIRLAVICINREIETESDEHSTTQRLLRRIKMKFYAIQQNLIRFKWILKLH